MKAFEFKPKLYTALKNYSKELFMADLMAGIIVGIVALPLAIAFGIASGVSPEKGIITAIIAGFIISLRSGADCRHVNGGRHPYSYGNIQAGGSH